MSENWVNDIQMMHDKYNTKDAVSKLSSQQLKEFIEFRYRFLEEELQELRQGIDEKNGDLIVDSIIDLCVVAIGTLDLFNVDSYTAWDRVLEANLNKSVGVKATRPNPLGLPDLIKNPGWIAPEHHDNLGLIQVALDNSI
jgi:predicted HAD superfamily Cof-like phosphohydrolase